MNDKLDLPPELAHLVEKRSGEDRRKGSAARDAGKVSRKNPADQAAPPAVERRRRRRRSP